MVLTQGGNASEGPTGTASEMPATRLVLTMNPETLREFFPIFQQGFSVTARVGCTLAILLGEQFGLSTQYVAERITTIFLDGKATDDVKTAIVKPNSTIALSGAMPGLVGATMRRGGYYAAMRSGITHTETGTNSENRIATVRIKLFNLLLSELGPGFLQRGIIMKSSELVEFLRHTSPSFWEGCSGALLDGARVGPMLLQSGEPFPTVGTVRLTVNFKV